METAGIFKKVENLSNNDTAIETFCVCNRREIIQEFNNTPIKQLQELFHSIRSNKFPSSDYLQKLIKESIHTRLKQILSIDKSLDVETLFSDMEEAIVFLTYQNNYRSSLIASQKRRLKNDI